MVINTKYNIGDNLYKLKDNLELDKIEIVSITIEVSKDVIKIKYHISHCNHNLRDEYLQDYELVKYGYHSSIDELKNNAIIKITNL